MAFSVLKQFSEGDTTNINKYYTGKGFTATIDEDIFGTGEIVLESTGKESLPLSNENYMTNVSFTSYYNGEKYNDTCIAEINYLYEKEWLFGDINE